ncbi:VOC family protein [Fodinibius salsisoli]|uniref:VOC family protein n=1 Tax=Fodinibius salsisoli TaxID=2820877 RepID=A0ABT3PHU5_9BACT|nr:VOC family protein [Fodinibius salsisoli]MCW9705496.1 VOC family protein [Fodinibius salsisoli]
MASKNQNPEYYRTVMPYLILENAEAFLDFTQTVFDAEIKMKHEDEKGLRHAEIVMGDSTIMVGQSGGPWDPQPAGLYINVSSADDTYQKALDAGATTVMELSNENYGRSGGVLDPFGNTWWITSVQD